ncbi:MAG: GTP cyclohydrolase I FolE [Syntrophomonadaceae bacterium]|jgi:GTP cyclohydrolase I|nr:GTP cyclohydrolase I FolE [Bacillota bacterium]NLM88556.1 GTP cyclohydrolase I FolE [Syntrophomonadaceae bacterium]HAA09126.1 GTP cyclohydrolase I FolE [Syntrophomonas sp.]HQA49680.1 GTP cyclohydrolase I FolE [Syntrophomonadaceae bacterium]HQD89677.1 GTP cyclohydrolase I FolE [Syntrophomonadaceae bacterium]
MTNREINKPQIVQAVRMILEAIGENPEREGLLNTPQRVAKMYEEIFSGMGTEPKEFLEVCFSEYHDELVLVKDIPIYSMCEHHLLPFYGKAHVAYIPKGGKVVGISKLVRVAEAYAHRPQLQERLTSQIADCIYDALSPYAVGVVIEAEHMCMTMRGVRKPGSITVTSAVRGLFETRSEVRAELFALINSK